jgi:hypothetical protein
VNRKRTRTFRQGTFACKHPEKYKGTFPILYRSAWESKVMLMLDNNPNIISWGSESVVIPYQNPLTGRTSRYFVDFNITMRDKEGNLKKFLIEIKPYSQTLPPVQTRNTRSLQRRQAEYIKNQKKWEAAQQWCKAKGYNFCVLTEKHLGF